MTLRNGLTSLLRPEDSVVVLIDHQPYQMANLNSHDPQIALNNATGLAKAAKAWQRDWAREATAGALTEVIIQHAAGSGIAFLWEQQLLNTPVAKAAG